MIDYDPFSDAVMRDPWPFYAQLRREAPVHYLEQYDTWFLSRFEDIWQSTTRDVFTAERGVTPEMVMLKAAPPPEPVFSMLDLPRQRDYRRMLAPPYGRHAIARRDVSCSRRSPRAGASTCTRTSRLRSPPTSSRS
jgi:cytochrome P450